MDPQAVKLFQSGGDGHNYDGWMKLCTEDIPDAWFERTRASGKWLYTERTEIPQGSRKLWYSPS
jgi:hypothetical protein